ncbi:usg protein [Afifella sp. IM 167]|uniref:usg protein n=1 Tax=Afifella sp. IM 167 TaxID=2033586 RepID=UPI001CCFDEA0|nr:usg protein [Afifella sp. IM 167]MBZ8134662.1 protein usg [Afifella sp. IM 167]
MHRSEPAHDGDFGRQLAGYGLTTANVLYYLPDRPSLIQSFVWQFYDVAPEHPRLERFLDFWRREIEAAIHSVEIAHERLLRPTEVRLANFEGRLH